MGFEVIVATSSPLLPYLFRSLGRCQSAPLLVKVLCCEHLSTRIWPGPKSISQETPNSCQMVLGLDGYQMNTILLATREAGPRFLFSISGCTQAPGSDLLAHSPTPDQQLPDFCLLGFAHCSKYSGWIKPELTCVYLRANEQFGPCFSSVITQLLFCLLVTPQGSVGVKAGLDWGFTLQVHPLCCFVVQLLGFLKNKGLQLVNHCDVFNLLV